MKFISRKVCRLLMYISRSEQFTLCMVLVEGLVYQNAVSNIKRKIKLIDLVCKGAQLNFH